MSFQSRLGKSKCVHESKIDAKKLRASENGRPNRVNFLLARESKTAERYRCITIKRCTKSFTREASFSPRIRLPCSAKKAEQKHPLSVWSRMSLLQCFDSENRKTVNGNRSANAASRAFSLSPSVCQQANENCRRSRMPRKPVLKLENSIFFRTVQKRKAGEKGRREEEPSAVDVPLEVLQITPITSRVGHIVVFKL